MRPLIDFYSLFSFQTANGDGKVCLDKIITAMSLVPCIFKFNIIYCGLLVVKSV